MTLCFQLPNHIPIPPLDHLIQKEGTASGLHVPNNSDVPTKPNISLFTYRSIEPPLAILEQLGKGGWVAAKLAMSVGHLVLAVEMKDVHGFTSCVEMLLANSLLMGIELAIIVVDKKLGSGFG